MRLATAGLISAYLTCCVGFNYQYNDDENVFMNTTVASPNVSVVVIVTETVDEDGVVVNDDVGEETRSKEGVSVTMLVLSVVAAVCFGFAVGLLLGSYLMLISKKASGKGHGGRQRWPEIKIFVPPIRENKSIQTDFDPKITNVALSPGPISFSSEFDMDGDNDVTDEFQPLTYGSEDANVTIADVHLKADDLVQKFTEMVVK